MVDDSLFENLHMLWDIFETLNARCVRGERGQENQTLRESAYSCPKITGSGSDFEEVLVSGLRLKFSFLNSIS